MKSCPRLDSAAGMIFQKSDKMAAAGFDLMWMIAFHDLSFYGSFNFMLEKKKSGYT